MNKMLKALFARFGGGISMDFEEVGDCTGIGVGVFYRSGSRFYRWLILKACL